MKLKIQELIEASGSELLAGSAEGYVTGVAIDSREVKPGDIFVAFKGDTVDAHRFLDQVIDAGCSMCVVSADVDASVLEHAQNAGCCVVRCKVDSPEDFLLSAGHLWRSYNPQWKVVAITGSVGKTTTKEMCACALSTTYKVHATKGNYNSLIGLPIVMMEASADDEVLVLEMGMDSPGEIEKLSLCAEPDVAIITNIGTSHIGILGSKENIAKTKAGIVAGMGKKAQVKPLAPHSIDSVLCLFSADEYTDYIVSNFADKEEIAVSKVGYNNQDDVYVESLELNGQGMPCFDLHVQGADPKHVNLSMPGKASVIDFMLALSAACAMGVDPMVAADAISELKSTSLRLEVKQTATSPKMIDDSYNASPTSMAEALDVMSAMECKGKRIAVLGEMGDMGDRAEYVHSLVGAYAAAKNLDMLCVIGTDRAAAIVRGARDVGMSEDRIVSFESVSEAVKILKPVFTHDDLILVKASRLAQLDLFTKEVLS